MGSQAERESSRGIVPSSSHASVAGTERQEGIRPHLRAEPNVVEVGLRERVVDRQQKTVREEGTAETEPRELWQRVGPSGHRELGSQILHRRAHADAAIIHRAEDQDQTARGQLRRQRRHGNEIRQVN